MFRNFIVLAYRHFIRSPLTSFIELFRMTAGLTVFLLVLLWVFNEVQYDQFNEKADRIYRLEHSTPSGSRTIFNKTMEKVVLEEELPEVEKAIRIRSWGSNALGSKYDDPNTLVNMGKFIFADDGFFDIFSFDFVAGDPESAFKNPWDVVLTESAAKAIFDDENPIGKTLGGNDNNPTRTVTAVIKDMPNFHVPFKAIYSFLSLKQQFEKEKHSSSFDNWGWQPINPTYLLVNANVDIPNLERKITELLHLRSPDNWYAKEDKFHLKPLTDIYFDDTTIAEGRFNVHGDLKKVIAYGTIAFFTLLLACINFINLNSAKSLERAKEVGIKKVSGASRSMVFVQYFGEVLILCVLSMILALIFTHTLLPVFNILLETNLSMVQLADPMTLLSMLLGLLLVSLASGGLPAMYMSAFQPVSVLKGIPKFGSKKSFSRSTNLVIQFSMTIILLIGTITTFKQIHYMKNADLGYDKEQILSFEFTSKTLGGKWQTLKNKLLSHPNVLKVSHSSTLPGKQLVKNAIRFPFIIDGVTTRINWCGVGGDFIKTMNIKMVQGRFFEKNRALDKFIWFDETQTTSIVINESAVKVLGLDEPIGTVVTLFKTQKARIVGVIKDFHLNSLQNRIVPQVFIRSNSKNNMIVKIKPEDMGITVDFINQEASNITGRWVNVTFIDQMIQRAYHQDENFAKLIGYFTIVAILIACMGLLGVSSHAIKLRIKEIGIRKTMGASSMQILNILAFPFIKTILLSIIFAIPISWVAMQAWLENYPYHINIEWWVLGLACGLTVLITFSTIIWQSWQASSQNPARLIRYE